MKSPAAAFVVAAVVVSCLTWAAALSRPDEPPVIVLSASNFSTPFKRGDGKNDSLVVVDFYAPWCPHCKKLEPEYTKAATTLKADGIKLAKVDCDDNKSLCSDQQVNSYPTVKVYRNGVFDHIFDGDHEADAIVAYMREENLPTLSILTNDTVHEFNNTERVVVIGVFDKDESKEQKALLALAQKHRRNARFGAIVDSSVAEDFGVKPPGLVLLKKFDEGKNVFDGEWNEKELESFFKDFYTPLVAELGRKVYTNFMKSGIPLAYLFLEGEEQREKLTPAIKSVAKKLREKMNFVFADAGEFGDHAENLGADKEWPSFLIHDIKAKLKFVIEPGEEVTEDSMQHLAQQVLDGTATPKLKTQPEPETNDGPVIDVVGTTYEKIVLDPTKDVLVEFWAPWCGYCKKLAPVYEQLGELYRAAKDIVIAKMDATNNDLPPGTPFSVNGFPTIKFVKANTNDPIDYQGNRSIESFVEFINNHTISTFNPFAEKEAIPEAQKEEVEEAKPDHHEREEL